MIPLDTVVTTEYTSGPDPVTHFNGYNTALVLGAAAPSASSGQALEALQRVANEVLLPKGYTLDWSGISYQETKVGNKSLAAFSFGLLMVFLVLAAQYESWVLPLAVILVVPMCLFCSLAGLQLAGMEITIFTQIGFIVLVGLASKNAILIVEFAKEERARGVPAFDAAVEACRLIASRHAALNRPSFPLAACISASIFAYGGDATYAP